MADPRAPQSKRHDLVVIGAGPGGYVAAIRAAQLGLDVACIEKEPRLGGTCLRIGCIPSKALLESSELFHESLHSFASHGIVAKDVQLDLKAMLARKDGVVDTLTKGIAGLFKKHKITRYEGLGRLAGSTRVEVLDAQGQPSERLEARHVLIATGSTSATPKGIELDGDRVGTSTEALSWPAVPRHLVVIGAGAIGLELGSVWRRLGAKVTVLEFLDRILPANDAEIALQAQKILAKQGLEFRLGARVTRARKDGDGALVEIEGQPSLHCDRVLVCVGRKPHTDGLGLDTVGIALDARGRIPVDAHFATSAEGIYAIGDVISGPMLAHKAEEEGVACVERIVTGYGHVNYDAIPNVVYTHPEVAGVGKTEEELAAAGIPYRKGAFPFLANGRAKALGATEGKVKILAHRDTDRILGVHIVGPRAGDLIAEAVAAMEFGASSEDLARTCHAHPTLAEAVKEAALAVDGRALHL
ncbi:MAG: dihydrolipoyl dehydrogenase [Planctomycetes bacterium]|nr:dihydrolipoyl dehydrogenase [Planctomycetota bacterium]